jgi:hypothetical protein
VRKWLAATGARSLVTFSAGRTSSEGESSGKLALVGKTALALRDISGKPPATTEWA